LDRDFIQKHTTGFDELIADLRQVSWDRIIEQSGISREQIDEAATLLQKSERIIACWAMGLTQHRTPSPTIQDIIISCSSAAASASRVPARARSAATATCKATARWAFGTADQGVS